MKRRYSYATPDPTPRKRRRSRRSSDSSWTTVSRAGSVGAGAAAGAYGSYSAVDAISRIPAAVNWISAEEGMAAGISEVVAAAEYFGAGEAAALGGAAVAGPVAVGAAAGAMVYYAGKYLYDIFYQKNANSTGFGMANTYGGKWMLGKNYKKGLRDKYQAYGAVNIVETYGTVSDPNLVVVGHSTWNLKAIAEAIAVATIRKLFRRAGYDVSSPYAELELITSSLSGADGFVVVFQVMDSDGTAAEATTTITNDMSLQGVANDKLYNYIYNSLTGENPSTLQVITLYQKHSGAFDSQRLSAQLNMKREVINMTCMSQLTVNNRSIHGTEAGTETADDMDTCPLKGPVFEFRGIPKTKQPFAWKLNTTDISGVLLTTAAAQIGTNVNDYQEPPTKTQFSNVSKSAYCRLPPAAIRQLSCASTHRGYFNNILVGGSRAVTENNRVAFIPGKSQMLFLEEEINRGSATSIKLSYENQHTIGVELVTTKAPAMTPLFQQNPYNV